AAYLRAVVDRHDVDLVVFDGTFVYRGVTQSCRIARVPLVWLRRGMWKDGVDRVQFDAPLTVADHVVVPADLGEVEHDGQKGSWITRVPPVALVSRDRLLPPAQAKGELGLDPAGQYVLVQTGRASFEGTASATAAVVAAVRECVPGMTPVVLVPPTLRERRLPEGVRGAVGRFPSARLLSAFELAVSAAGYNSVHENVAACLPTVFVPYRQTLTDDQVARAAGIADRGLGLVASSDAELRTALTTLADHARRTVLRERLSRTGPLDGGTVAAAEIMKVLAATRHGTVLGRSSLGAAVHGTAKLADDLGFLAADVREGRRDSALETERIYRSLAAVSRALDVESSTGLRRRADEAAAAVLSGVAMSADGAAQR
ncbi:MAG: hypothetical protein LBU50_05340, partial [Cellulomonas sp.]|nr:hypothetical protein [Cellulomonas sp.]